MQIIENNNLKTITVLFVLVFLTTYAFAEVHDHDLKKNMTSNNTPITQLATIVAKNGDGGYYFHVPFFSYFLVNGD